MPDWVYIDRNLCVCKIRDQRISIWIRRPFPCYQATRKHCSSNYKEGLSKPLTSLIYHVTQVKFNVLVTVCEYIQVNSGRTIMEPAIKISQNEIYDSRQPVLTMIHWSSVDRRMALILFHPFSRIVNCIWSSHAHNCYLQLWAIIFRTYIYIEQSKTFCINPNRTICMHLSVIVV